VDEIVMDRVGLVLSIALVAALTAVALWDISMVFTGRTQHTVSEYMHRWSAQFPLLPFAAGMVAGHLWFR